MTRITFLGTGTSYGVPRIGCSCATCRSSDPRDRRFRSSIIVESRAQRLLIDATPDLRSQLLANGISRLDAVAITHFHSDHVMGIDDLRAITDAMPTPLPLVAPHAELQALTAAFPHLFGPKRPIGMAANLALRAWHSGESGEVAGFELQGWMLPHGRGFTMGYLVEGKVAYLTDISQIPDSVVDALTGVRVLILDMLREEAHPTHLNLERSLEYARRIGAEATWFIHMSHEVMHARVEAVLPPTFRLAFDGLTVDVD